MHSYIQAWHFLSIAQMSRDSLYIPQISSGLCQTRRPQTRVLRVDCTSICALERKSLANFESRVLTSNKGLRVSQTLHESTRHL